MDPSRRHLLQLLVSLGLTCGSVDGAVAQMRTRLKAEDLQGALAIQDRELPSDTSEIVRRALQQSLDEFAPVRALEIDDAIGLPVVFRPVSRAS
jgi:hypothetical protein